VAGASDQFIGVSTGTNIRRDGSTIISYFGTTMSDLDNEYKHDDFEVVRRDERFGGFEEVKLKNQNDALPVRTLRLWLIFEAEGAYSTRAFSANPLHQIVSSKLMTCMCFHCCACVAFLTGPYRIALQVLAMKERCSGTIHPMYTHHDRKWALMSVPDEHYEATGLAA